MKQNCNIIAFECCIKIKIEICRVCCKQQLREFPLIKSNIYSDLTWKHVTKMYFFFSYTNLRNDQLICEYYQVYITTHVADIVYFRHSNIQLLTERTCHYYYRFRLVTLSVGFIENFIIPCDFKHAYLFLHIPLKYPRIN